MSKNTVRDYLKLATDHDSDLAVVLALASVGGWFAAYHRLGGCDGAGYLSRSGVVRHDYRVVLFGGGVGKVLGRRKKVVRYLSFLPRIIPILQ